MIGTDLQQVDARAYSERMERVLSHGGTSRPIFRSKHASRFQFLLDSTVPFVYVRWITLSILIVALMSRIAYVQGYYIVAYVYWIFFLNQFILFLSPKFDSTGGRVMSSDDLPPLPTRSTDEFRPFVRRLPEFKFWLYSINATQLSIICTFIEPFNVPVFWPILFMYFITLFLVTMRRQIAHMIRYRYVPFTYGKVRYNSAANEKSGPHDGHNTLAIPKPF